MIKFLMLIFIILILYSFSQTVVTGHISAEIIDLSDNDNFLLEIKSKTITMQSDNTILIDTVYITKIYE